MKYFLKGNQIFGFEEDGSQNHLITSDMVPISWEEVQERTLPPLEVRQRNEFKAQRAEAVQAITVTTTAGNTFDGDETSQNRMTRSIVVMNDTDTITWVLADNTELAVSKAELIEALKLAGQEQSRLWTPTTGGPTQ